MKRTTLPVLALALYIPTVVKFVSLWMAAPPPVQVLAILAVVAWMALHVHRGGELNAQLFHRLVSAVGKLLRAYRAFVG